MAKTSSVLVDFVLLGLLSSMSLAERVQAALAVSTAPLSPSAFGAAPPSHCFFITPTPQSTVIFISPVDFEIPLVDFEILLLNFDPSVGLSRESHSKVISNFHPLLTMNAPKMSARTSKQLHERAPD